MLDDIADDDDDWVQLGVLGQNIGKLRPAFDPRLYGFKKLSDLIKGYPKRFELQARGSTASGGKDLYVRSK
ncbi:OST-HTH/LOTUS domain protein [compost metagenome]